VGQFFHKKGPAPLVLPKTNRSSSSLAGPAVGIILVASISPQLVILDLTDIVHINEVLYRVNVYTPPADSTPAVKQCYLRSFPKLVSAISSQIKVGKRGCHRRRRYNLIAGTGGKMSDLVGNLVVMALLLVGLWWLWEGLVGTWYLLNYLLYKGGCGTNSCLIILIGIIFGWNAIPAILIFLVCLGPITLAIVRSLLENEISRV
jgi:hypothetical protein